MTKEIKIDEKTTIYIDSTLSGFKAYFYRDELIETHSVTSGFKTSKQSLKALCREIDIEIEELEDIKNKIKQL